MKITAQTVVEKIRDYLARTITLAELVDWAETALIDDEFVHHDTKQLFDIVGRLGLADSDQFGLSWDDLESTLNALGYDLRVHPELVKKPTG